MLQKHGDFPIPITCVWVRNEVRTRVLPGLDGEKLPDWLETIRVDPHYVCFFSGVFVKIFLCLAFFGSCAEFWSFEIT